MEQERNRRSGLEISVPRKSSPYKRRRRERLALKIGTWVFAVAFLFGGIVAGGAWLGDRKANAAYGDVRAQVQMAAYTQSVSPEALEAPIENLSVASTQKPAMDFAALREINADIVAWLTADGTVIDYPVLRGTDNEYYMHHLYNRESNRVGSLFADYRNTGLFAEKNTVIYGHNMKSGAMFNTLAEYKDQGYYDAIPTMKLYTPDGDYTIELFSGTVEDGNNEFVRFDFETDADFMAYIQSFRSRSTFASGVTVEPGDRIVSLCTCSYETSNSRYMLMGRLVQN